MSAEDIEYMGDYKEFPTKESALDWLDYYLSLDERNNLIRALEQEPILDKIRAEITNIHLTDTDGHNNNWYREPQAIINDALRIIDKYKAESEK